MESHGPESRNDSNLTLTLNHTLRFTPSGASVTLIQIHTHPFRASVTQIQIQIHSVQSLVIQSQIQSHRKKWRDSYSLRLSSTSRAHQSYCPPNFRLQYCNIVRGKYLVRGWGPRISW